MTMGEVFDRVYLVAWGIATAVLAWTVVTGRWRGVRLTRAERCFSAGCLVGCTGLLAYAVLATVVPSAGVAAFAVAAGCIGLGLILAS